MGATLRVYNGSGAYVDVRVGLHWEPLRNATPVYIDLERAAFARLAPLGVGSLRVQIEQLDGAAAFSPRREEVKDMIG